MSHKKLVRPPLYANRAGDGRVVRVKDLAEVVGMEPSFVLGEFGPLSNKSHTGEPTGSLGTVDWEWQISCEMEQDDQPDFVVRGAINKWSNPGASNLDDIARRTLPWLYVPAGWSERVCEAWEAGIRLLKLEASGPNVPLPGTLLQGKDEGETIWCIRGVLADRQTIYTGRNPISA